MIGGLATVKIAASGPQIEASFFQVMANVGIRTTQASSTLARVR